MKFTELCDYPLSGGIVTQWIPVTESDPTTWISDPRPLTYDHEAALRATSDSDHEISWLGAVFEIDERYDPDALRSALRQWMIRHEAFRTVADAATCRRTYRGDQLDLRSEVAGHLDTGAKVSEFLTRSFDENLSPDRWPHVRVASIASLSEAFRPDRFVVVFAADHVVMDAYSIMLSISEIQALYRAELNGTDAWLPEVGSHVDFSCDDRQFGGELTETHPAVCSWRRFLTSPPSAPAGGVPHHPTRLGTTDSPSRRPQRSFADYIVDADQAELISNHSRTCHTRTQTSVFAAMALAYRALCDEPVLRVVMPWHTRHAPQYLLSIGWYVGLGPLEVDLTDAATFADALAATDQGVADARAVSRAPHRRVNEIIGNTTDPGFVASYLDFRRVPGAEQWPASRAHALRSASHSDREVYVWIARVPSGITLNARYPDSALAGESMERFVDVIRSVLHTLASDGPNLPLDHYLTTAGRAADQSRTA